MAAEQPAYTYWADTDVGGRQHNEDHFLYLSEQDTGQQGTLIVVSDGMGGERGGKQASRAISAVCKQQYPAARRRGLDMHDALEKTLLLANAEILRLAAENTDLKGMGSTTVALAHDNGVVAWAHAGDSRVYHVESRSDELHCLTIDHSRVAELVASGKLSQEAAEQHPDAHVITRALGRPGIVPDLNGRRKLSSRGSGTTFLLCSDGLYSAVNENIIGLAMRSLPPEIACKALIEIAKLLQSSDNITVAILQTDNPLQPATLEQFFEQATQLLPAGAGVLVPSSALRARAGESGWNDHVLTSSRGTRTNRYTMASGAAGRSLPSVATVSAGETPETINFSPPPSQGQLPFPIVVVGAVFVSLLLLAIYLNTCGSNDVSNPSNTVAELDAGATGIGAVSDAALQVPPQAETDSGSLPVWPGFVPPPAVVTATPDGGTTNPSTNPAVDENTLLTRCANELVELSEQREWLARQTIPTSVVGENRVCGSECCDELNLWISRCRSIRSDLANPDLPNGVAQINIQLGRTASRCSQVFDPSGGGDANSGAERPSGAADIDLNDEGDANSGAQRRPK